MYFILYYAFDPEWDELVQTIRNYLVNKYLHLQMVGGD